MRCEFKQCKQEEIIDFIQDYICSLQSPFDSFLEERILQSTFYKINYNGEIVGYYAIFKDYLLTQYYIKVPLYSKSQDIFEQVFSNHQITSIFVPTSDEFLLSTVVDNDYKIKKQAYFFQDSKIHIPQEKLNKSGQFRKADISDADKILEVSTDFLDRLEERIDEGQIFVFIKENNILGVGIIERSILQEGYASVGMFTNEDFRMQGIGRTIIHYLKEWCYSNNLTPISGCWYYNINSKLTLESAGMVTKTRLLNFQVRE